MRSREESEVMKRSVRRTLAGAMLATCLPVLFTGAASQAALSTPDAMCYGRVSVNGQAQPGSVVSARLGEVVLGSSVVGADATAPSFYGVAISIAQSTEAGEVLAPGTAADGSTVRLYVNDRFAGEVQVRTGLVTRRDLSGGQTVCAGGANDGQSCMDDGDCPGGFCTISRALCDGGADDGQACQCIGGTCSAAAACPQNASRGTCAGGPLAGECCDVAQNCAGGATCAGSQKLCQGGSQKGMPCLRDSHCPGSTCVSPTLVCIGGSQAGYSCLDAGQCPGGTCGQRVATPTPSATPTGGVGSRTPTPTATATPEAGGCAGDCDGDGTVSIAELIRMVNIALGSLPLSQCPISDRNGDGMVNISELIGAVGRALSSCDS